MTDTTSLRREAMEALEGTTEGPWSIVPAEDGETSHVGSGPWLSDDQSEDGGYFAEYHICRTTGFYQSAAADARFIAASRTLVPQLVAALEAAEARAEFDARRADNAETDRDNWQERAMDEVSSHLRTQADLARVTAERDAERAMADELAGALEHMTAQFQHPDEMADLALAAYAKHKEGRSDG